MKKKKIALQWINGRPIPVMDTQLADFEGEEWKDLPDVGGYQVSSHGRVKSKSRYLTDVNGVRYLKNEKILKLTVASNGSDYVAIKTVLTDEDKKRLNFVVPRLVYYLFVATFDLYDASIIVIKKDGDHLNCHYKNLELVSASQNITGTYAKGRKSNFDKNRLPVHQYDGGGNFVSTYASIVDAAKVNGVTPNSIRFAIQFPNRQSKQSYWRHGDAQNSIDVANLIAERRQSASSKKVRVQQLSPDGALIRSYDSMTAAADAVGVYLSSIVHACQGKNRICKGFRWQYADSASVAGDERTGKQLKSKKVLQLNLDGTLVGIHENVSAASTAMGVHYGVISKACKILHLTCRGFCWRFAEG